MATRRGGGSWAKRTSTGIGSVATMSMMLRVTYASTGCPSSDSDGSRATASCSMVHRRLVLPTTTARLWSEPKSGSRYASSTASLYRPTGTGATRSKPAAEHPSRMRFIHGPIIASLPHSRARSAASM
jgi:hypothetical protein